MKYLLTACLLTSLLVAKAQPAETISAYFDKDWKVVPDSVDAAFYRIVEETGLTFIVRDYFISGKIQMVAECSQATPKLIHEGKTVFYYENGVVKEEGWFKADIRTGVWKYSYEIGKPKTEIVYEDKDRKYHYYLSETGEDLIPNGNGFVQEPNKKYRQYTEIEDFLAVASFSVDNETNDTVYTSLDQLPEYGGGYSQLGRDIGAYLAYPKSARRMGIEGTVYVQFIVDKTGGITGCNVLRGISADCDAEALAAVNKLKKWAPGMHHGRAVKTRFVLPVTFKLKG